MHQYLPHIGLLTDFYQLTMAQAHYDHKRHDRNAVFQFTFRKNPFQGNWTIAAGIDDAISFINDFHFDDASLEFLRTIRQSNQQLFSEDFLAFLKTSKIHLDVWGVNNGEIVFPHEPILRIEGPLYLCQLLETPLLNIINFQSLIATKAARIAMAAGKKSVIDFGLRRAHGFDGAISASKAAFLGGVVATSNLWAAYTFGIPPAGTQAHSFVMSYPQEQDAFKDFAHSYPTDCVLLIDTYDPKDGITHAIETFRTMPHANLGIRIDSGDLLALSTLARGMLDRAGFERAKIIASGDLDEYEIRRLETAQAPIDSYGVGTKLITAFDEPALGGIYKLVSIKEHNQWRDTYKTSASSFKRTHPGSKTIHRFFHHNKFAFDQVFDAKLAQPTQVPAHDYDQSKPLLNQFMMNGSIITNPHDLICARDYVRTNMSYLPNCIKDLSTSTKPYSVYFDNNEDIRESAHID